MYWRHMISIVLYLAKRMETHIEEQRTTSMDSLNRQDFKREFDPMQASS